jgi:hypothetical protein
MLAGAEEQEGEDHDHRSIDNFPIVLVEQGNDLIGKRLHFHCARTNDFHHSLSQFSPYV